MTTQHEDAVLFALRDECGELLEVYLKAKAEAHEARARADAAPDCPPVDASPRAHEVHRTKYGCNEPWDRMNLANSRIRAMSLALLNGGAETLEGVLAKIRFVHLLEEKCDDLETWPYYDEWLDRIECDLDDLVRVHAKPTGEVVTLVSEAPESAAQDWFGLVTNLDNPIANLKCIRSTLLALASADDLIHGDGLWPIHDVLKKAIEVLSATLENLYAMHRMQKAEAVDAG